MIYWHQLHIIIVIVDVVAGPVGVAVAIVGDIGAVGEGQLMTSAAHAGQLAIELLLKAAVVPMAQSPGNQIAMVVSARGLIVFTATAAAVVA